MLVSYYVRSLCVLMKTIMRSTIVLQIRNGNFFLYSTVPTRNENGVHCFVQHSVPFKRTLGVKRTIAKC